MYQRKDSFYTRAKGAGYRSRAAYKLMELDQRFHLMRPGDCVVDLGAWPGGWLQVAAERVGAGGVVIGLDRTPIDRLPPPVVCVTGDAASEETLAQIRALCGRPADVVISDMAPQLSGIRARDEARAEEIAESALAAAESLLRPGGRFVVKLFQCDATRGFLVRLRRRFDSVRSTRAEASRAGSAEIYAIAIGLRPGTPA